MEVFGMVTAATGEADGRAALAAGCVTDRVTMERVLAGRRSRTAVDPLSRHEWLDLPADALERRTRTPLVRGVR